MASGVMMRNRVQRATLLLVLAWAAGCARDEGLELRPLLDGEHAPDVLTEQREVALPPSLSGNRFLTGWWPWLHEERLVLAPLAPTVRLEVVSLGAGPRTLVLDLLQEAASKGKVVRVKVAGRDLGAFPLADPLEVPLPADLPRGRVPVEMSFEWGSRGVLAAAVRPARPAGEVRLRGADLVQSGDSLVDLVHRVPAGSTLVGSFRPPLSAQAGQSFELTVEREDGTPVQRYSWSPGIWNRLRQRIELPLAGVEGFVRVRLQARGKGPAGRWEDLAFSAPRQAASEPRPEIAVRPGRPAPRLVVVYVMDALRADAVGHLGGLPGISPVYDRLAREGVTFKRHRSVAPNTIPSTKALFTGRTFVSGGDLELGSEEGTTLAELFREAGYRTGLFSGNIYISPAFGTDRGFDHVASEVLIDDYTATEQPPYNDNATRAHAAALSWLRSLPQGEPAFLYFHTIHPHNPYDPPDPYRSRYTAGIPSSIDGSTETLLAVRKGRVEAGPDDQRRLRGLYAGSFAYNDAELGDFLRQVTALVPREEVLVVLTSDHGEELFEHGGVLHSYTLYEEMVGIPLVLWSPGRLEPGAVTVPTDTLDLHATLLGLGGLRRPEGAEGRSLLGGEPRRGGDYIHLAAASSVVGGIYSVQWGKWKLVWAPRSSTFWGMGDGRGRSRDPEYLFDLAVDPGEKVNVAGEPSLEVAWLRSRLLAWVQRNRDASPRQPARPIDPETERRLRALGYANTSGK